jgi:Predicted N6-adenine-specific DNA methylase
LAAGFASENHDLVFLHSIKKSEECRNMRITEEVCHCLAWGQYKISSNILDKIAEELSESKKSYRLAVTLDGKHFNRQDMNRWFKKELIKRRVKLSEDSKHLIWLFLIDEKFYVAVQESSFHQVLHRNKRQQEREGSLPVTIAAAMAFAGYPQQEEIIIDPTCGSGTLLAETYAYQPHIKSVTGFDIDPEAIAAAEANLKHVEQAQLVNTDFTVSNLPENSSHLFLANLPFGKQYGDTDANPDLYANILAEIQRIGINGKWRAILLTSDTEALKSALQKFPELEKQTVFSVKTRGELAKAHMIKLRSDK